MRKKTKREKTQYPEVTPNVNLKNRYEEIMDIQEYFDDLDDNAKKWINKFAGEYINDSLDRKNLKNNLHNTKKLKKSCDDRNNARNRDLYNRGKSNMSLRYLEDLKKKEDRIISKLDEYKK